MAEEDGIEETVSNAASGLKRKIGPLPLWVWLVGGLGVAVGAYLFIFKRSASTPASGAPATNMLGSIDGGTVGGGGGGSGGGSTSAAAGPLTNADWLQSALSGVQQSTGLPTAQVLTYLQEYLAGKQPTGNASAVTAFESVVQSALQSFGRPPQSVSYSGVNSSAYESNQAYLQSLLTFLPQGTGGSVRGEITSLFGGLVTNISQAAQDAITYAQGIVGIEPTALSYTVGTAATPVVTPTPAAKPTLPAASTYWQKIQDWAATYQKANGGHWPGDDLLAAKWAETTGLSVDWGKQIYQQYWAYKATNKTSAGTAQIDTWLKQIAGQ